MRLLSATLVSAVAVLAACGGKPKPESPAPISDPGISSATPTGRGSVERSADSAAAAERARIAGALAETIFFSYDQAALNSAARTRLDAKAAVLRANPNMRLVITGHADERGSDEYNLALGMRRATATRQYLVQSGITSARLEAVSYGEERPADRGHDERAYAANRRAEFIVGGSQFSQQ